MGLPPARRNYHSQGIVVSKPEESGHSGNSHVHHQTPSAYTLTLLRISYSFFPPKQQMFQFGFESVRGLGNLAHIPYVVGNLTKSICVGVIEGRSSVPFV